MSLMTMPSSLMMASGPRILLLSLLSGISTWKDAMTANANLMMKVSLSIHVMVIVIIVVIEYIYIYMYVLNC